MAKEGFVPKADDLVHSNGLDGVFKVTAVRVRDKQCIIQRFDVSKHLLIDEPVAIVASSDLFPFEEDASQAAARIVREATEEK